MHNIRIRLAYDGTDFRGWQIQPGQPTVQGLLIDVIERLTQVRPAVQGAGRTDAGVHAAGQVANFVTESKIPPQDFQRALNALLPPSVRVTGSEEVPLDFHARLSAVAKTYRYTFFRGPVLPPFLYRYVHHEPRPLDFDAMAEAARLFVGEHDFASFAASTGSEEDDRERITTRTIYSSEWMRIENVAPHGSAEEWIYVVRGRSFLRYMVRKIVGTLVEVGRGKLRPEEITSVLDARDRTKSGPTMPPSGLCMMEVEYEDARSPAIPKELQSATKP